MGAAVFRASILDRDLMCQGSYSSRLPPLSHLLFPLISCFRDSTWVHLWISFDQDLMFQG